MGKKLGILSLLFIVVSCHLVSKEYNTEIKTIQGKYLHFSLDDVQNICYNLQTYDKGTIFPTQHYLFSSNGMINMELL